MYYWWSQEDVNVYQICEKIKHLVQIATISLINWGLSCKGFSCQIWSFCQKDFLSSKPYTKYTTHYLSHPQREKTHSYLVPTAGGTYKLRHTISKKESQRTIKTMTNENITKRPLTTIIKTISLLHIMEQVKAGLRSKRKLFFPA